MKAMAAVLSVVAIMISGCATTGYSPSASLSDEEQIAQLFAAWKTAFDAMDVDAYLALFSESYEDFDGMDKKTLEERTSDGFDERYLNDIQIQVTIDAAEITVTGDTALFKGIVLKVSDDTEAFGFKLKKEQDGVWRIIGEGV